MESYERHDSNGFEDVERRLRDERRVATPLELDQIRHDIVARVQQPGRSRRNGFMKSRIAITLMVVLGIGFSTSGGALAVSGISGSGDAAGVQYQGENKNNEQIGPEENTPVETNVPSSNAETPKAATPKAPVAQSTQQFAAVQSNSGSSLPFTGYNAIPIFVGGLALLALGLVMRRQVRRDS